MAGWAHVDRGSSDGPAPFGWLRRMNYLKPFSIWGSYTYGIGVAVDEQMAQRWLKKAFKGGIREAALEVAWPRDARNEKAVVKIHRLRPITGRHFVGTEKRLVPATLLRLRTQREELPGGQWRFASRLKGAFWLQRAALSGDAAAADALEYFYEDGLYMPDPQGRMRLFWASYAEGLRDALECR